MRYEQIEKIVDEMYEDLDFAELPLDIFKLCQKLQINLIKYSNIKPCKKRSNKIIVNLLQDI